MQLDQCKNPVLVAAVSKIGGVRATAKALECSRGAVDQWLAGGGVYALQPALRLVALAWPEANPKQQTELLGKLARASARVRKASRAPAANVHIPTLDELLGGTSGD